ncbi:m-AAA protease-interacting protein 1, mitochondrial [Salarias fasciatus]|uniref:M-AAA protease-interacting protein 1, mitochondrial-like n=1 Tax=Salarias fasciatus TaxID=181472 RepID=A0A672F435_SALFA|nr:m-AAA protease-interacting protein 1, mitochondrial-like [Salarias fasciatus]
MQRITSLAACRELGGLAACSAGLCGRRRGGPAAVPLAPWGGVAPRPGRPFSAEPGRRESRRGVVFAGDKRRLFCTQNGAENPPGGSQQRPAISVVGIPDPFTWIRCKVQMSLIDLYFDLDMDSEEFHRGIKQALVHVSDKMSRGRYHELRGLASNEVIEYVEKKCTSLTAAQRQQLAVKMDDIIFVLPEEVSVIFDNSGGKFCSIVMRFWLVSTHEGPDDPEGIKIFKVASSEEGGPQKKIATAVYEFHRELTRGASDDWTVTTVWHYSWTLPS